MSRKKAATQAWQRARQATDQLKPVAAQARPLASRTMAAVKRQVFRTRTWAAPQVERTGQVLEEKVAPKVSGALSSAARRIDPRPNGHRRWAKRAGLATLTAAASAAAAVARKRRKPDGQTATPPPAAGADAARTGDGKAKDTSPAEAK